MRPWEVVTLYALCGAFITVESIRIYKGSNNWRKSCLAGTAAGFGSLLGAGLIPDKVATPVSLICGILLGFNSVRKSITKNF